MTNFYTTYDVKGSVSLLLSLSSTSGPSDLTEITSTAHRLCDAEVEPPAPPLRRRRRRLSPLSSLQGSKAIFWAASFLLFWSAAMYLFFDRARDKAVARGRLRPSDSRSFSFS